MPIIEKDFSIPSLPNNLFSNQGKRPHITPGIPYLIKDDTSLLYLFERG
ncbi:hypothetical protein SAMN05421503_2295 [Terribacillus aidingensis]|uniref:Uncharacterized protein n=1 Tax=Terribacillus aidingensis TaxID=586416 RepID=A0A285NXP8_9BACI|nr:hypothetical protein SAMN05421503_2295 [Terribacillus aidingensis]